MATPSALQQQEFLLARSYQLTVATAVAVPSPPEEKAATLRQKERWALQAIELRLELVQRCRTLGIEPPFQPPVG